MFQIEKLKSDFDNIIAMKKEIRSRMDSTNTKLSNLKNTYNKMIKENAKQIFLFCLDSFFYQYKIFAMELDNIEKLRCILNNRMYCDYYKLHNIVLRYMRENKNDIGNIDESELRTFPVYKDLEPFIQYEIEDIRSLHDTITKFMIHLYKSSEKKAEHVESYNKKDSIGFSISNFLNTLTHENSILKKQIGLYINYISFFHISQKKQLSHLSDRIQDFCKEVDQNINTNHIFSIDDISDEPDRSVLISDFNPNKYSVESPIAPPSTPNDTNKDIESGESDNNNTAPVYPNKFNNDIDNDSIPESSGIEIKELDMNTIPRFVPILTSACPEDDNISPISTPGPAENGN